MFYTFLWSLSTSCLRFTPSVLLMHFWCYCKWYWDSVGLWGGFPGGFRGKEPACQCRRHKRWRFDPQVGEIPWRRKWQPTPVFLPGKFHGQRSLGGYSPWGCRVRHNWSNLAHTVYFFKITIKTIKIEQLNPKIYMKSQKIWGSQCNLEEKNKLVTWRYHSPWLQTIV